MELFKTETKVAREMINFKKMNKQMQTQILNQEDQNIQHLITDIIKNEALEDETNGISFENKLLKHISEKNLFKNKKTQEDNIEKILLRKKSLMNESLQRRKSELIIKTISNINLK